MVTKRFVELATDGAVATITLNRPERHNSLIPELLEHLLEAFAAAEQQPGVGAMVLAASGKSFSTGGDVGEFYARRNELATYAGRIVGLLNEVILTMLRSPLPIVAAVHGMVTGGSLGLVLAADVVLVSPAASFTPWYTVVGYSPDGGWSTLLPQVIGRSRTRAVLLENSTITADQAVEWGLAARIAPAAGLAAEAHRAAAAIAGMQPQAVASSKRLAHGEFDRIAAGLEAERTAFVTQIVTDEALAGMQGFLGIAAER